MSKLFYCTKCLRVVSSDNECSYCKSDVLKELSIKAPVNVIGSKLKGRVLKITEGKAKILIKDESNNKFIKDYDADKIKKII